MAINKQDDPFLWPAEVRWYCVKTQPKREAIAYGQLTTLPEVEAFFPRVRYRRASDRGTRMVVDALFPGYLFAKFSPARLIRAVRYARGVSYIVRQGTAFAPVPDSIINALHSLAATQILELPPEPWKMGEQVRVIAGIFRGATGTIAGLVPARQRVQVLLELLGQERSIDLPLDNLELRHAHPLQTLRS